MGRVDELIRQLETGDGWERRLAALELGQLGDPKAVPALLEALDDGYHGLRIAAALAIGQIGDLNAIPKLLDTYERCTDYRYFPETILEAIDRILGRTSIVDEKSRAVYSRVADRLIQHIQKDPRSQLLFMRATAAAEALARTRDPKAIRVLTEQLREDNPRPIAAAAARALRHFNTPQVIQALTQTAANRNISPSVREAAVKSLNDIGNPKTKRRMATVDKLIWELQSEDPKKRRKAAELLGQIDDPKAFLPLLRALDDRDGDTEVEVAAARSLGRIGVPNLAPSLFAVYKIHGREVARAILDAICAIYDRTSPDDDEIRAYIFDTLIEEVEKESEKPYLRAEVARALSRINDPKAIEPLIRTLEHEASSTELRKAVIDALAEFRDTRVIDALIRGFRDVNIARAAVEALKKLRDKRAVEPLIRIFECKDGIRESDYERALAVEVLGAIDDPRAVPILVKALRDKYERVRRYAFEAIPPFIPTHPDAILRIPPEDRNLLGRLIQDAQNDELLRELCKKPRRKTRR